MPPAPSIRTISYLPAMTVPAGIESSDGAAISSAPRVAGVFGSDNGFSGAGCSRESVPEAAEGMDLSLHGDHRPEPSYFARHARVLDGLHHGRDGLVGKRGFFLHPL